MQPDRDFDRLLADAGARARADRDATPDRDFADALKDRLLAQLPDASHEPRVGWSLGNLFRLPRLVPMAAGVLLLVGAVIAGRDLYVALGDHPTPTPQPSLSATPPASLEPVFTTGPTPSASLEPRVPPHGATSSAAGSRSSPSSLPYRWCSVTSSPSASAASAACSPTPP